jgi:diguanylate cyclase (GGDEF)-like protein
MSIPDQSAQESSKGNILLVDDKLDNLSLLTSLLEEQGYEVRNAINGPMALMGAQADPPDLILLDITMPEMSGYTVCEWLKSDDRTREIPILFISALDDVEDKLRAFEVGGVDYITKPFHAAEVLARVEHQLTIRRLHRQFQAANAQLVELNTLLEQRVQQRTAELEHQVFYDSLTDLPSRAYLLHRIEQGLQRCQQDPAYGFALLFLDCDQFRLINSSLGHAIGDQLLIAIGERLSTCLVTNDLLSRPGEDDFVFFLNRVLAADIASQRAEQILEKFVTPFSVQGFEIFMSASIGVVLGSHFYQHPVDPLRDANTAMYVAKAKGRGHYHLFDQAMHSEAVQRLHLENDLRRAVNRLEFRVYYQPIMNLSTGKIYAFESLVRWEHPQRGMVSPAEFMGCVEETGLVVPIGISILKQACQQLKVWQTGLSLPDLIMSVNLSARQFTYPHLLQDIDRVLQEAEIDPHCLKLEITESVVMDNAQAAIEIVQQLRDRHIHLSIDDFGTGYSSLSYLQKFPVNSLKIDRSFIQDIGSSGENAQIAKTIVDLGHDLGMTIIAEGIENHHQINCLKQMGCEYGQGYYFSQPLDSEQATKMLKAHTR